MKPATVKIVKRQNIQEVDNTPVFPALYKYKDDGSIYLFTDQLTSICLIDNGGDNEFGDTSFDYDCLNGCWKRLPSNVSVKIFNQI